MTWLLLAAAISAGGPAPAHEVRPSVADLTLAPGAATLRITLNLEAFIAGVDLDGLENTDEAENAAAYDRLRALGPAALEAALRADWPRIRAGVSIVGADGPAVAEIAAVDIPGVGDADLPRDSVLTVSAAATPPVRVGWARAYGALILRQQGEPTEAAYTGYLEGGETSPPIEMGPGAGMGAVALRHLAAGLRQVATAGLDHVLLLLGLVLLARRPRPLARLAAAFALGRVAALTLGGLGLVAAPAAVVEPLAAATVVLVAAAALAGGATAWWSPLAVFVCGAPHGLGLAAAFAGLGAPPTQTAPALIGFALGVEAALLAVLAAAYPVAAWLRHRPGPAARIAPTACAAIAALGAWLIVARAAL